jgi:hypothetical protein
MHTVLFILECWVLPFPLIIGGFWLLAEFIWRVENRPLSLRRARKLINQNVTAAMHDMETVATRWRP